MSVFNRSEEQRCLDDLHHPDEEVIGSLCRLSDRAVSPGTPSMDQEKRIRREIANSNERRRMQSINAGFQSLRTLLPHHEGEKLSKAAILQQTAEYIYQLEQEKTSLLSQNCQLKRLVNQHEGQAETICVSKKRKLDPAQTGVLVSESSDEGIGSMSPEPAAVTGGEVTAAGGGVAMIELRVQLDRERRQRLHLEEQVRSLEHQLYPEKIREITQQVHLQYHHQEVVEHESVSLIQETAAAVAQLQVVSASIVPHIGQTTTIVATSPLCISGPSSPTIQIIGSPLCHSPLIEEEEAIDDTCEVNEEQRLPSVLEAAMKAEPKVEVERLPSPTSDDVIPQARLFLNSTSRQNLETIVEAIRHLEGDHLFCDEPPASASAAASAQEAPLALTKKEPTQQQVAQRLLKVEMNPYLQFHAGGSPTPRSLQQQQRPGVIVVKQQT